jgi:glycosyltransferase involved in cell wall biosynthesis
MDLIVNGPAVLRSSLGARRYYHGVMKHLNWPGKICVEPLGRSAKGDRIREVFMRGRRDAIFWSPCHRGPFFAHNHVVTVLDCINVQYTYRDDWRLPILRATMGTLLANATAVATISHATRDAVLDCFGIDPRKVIAIPGPTDFRAEMAEVGDAATDGDDFILMVTNALPHKNTLRAAHALAASSAARRGMTVRVVGTLGGEGVAVCREAGLRVEQHQGVDEAVLRQWLKRSLFLFSPSLQEGLNLPIGEAMALGGRVLCSDIPVHREFYDGAVLFCDPRDVNAMVRGIDQALERPRPWAMPGPLQAWSGFSEVAQEYNTLFHRVAGGEFSRLARS